MASSREVPSSLFLSLFLSLVLPLASLTLFCLTLLFPSESLVASFAVPLYGLLSRASLRIQTRQPSTSTTIHRQRLRRLTLLEMHRLRRMFENVFSPPRSSPSVLQPSLPSKPRLLSPASSPVTDGNLATDLLPEMLTKCSRVPPPVAASRQLPAPDVYPCSTTVACVPRLFQNGSGSRSSKLFVN